MSPKAKKILTNIAIFLPALVGIGAISKYFYDNKKAKAEEDIPPPSDPSKGKTQTADEIKSSLSSKNCKFPLQKGSKSDCVKQLQQALINAFGNAILPKYGADKDWGSETEKAVKEKLKITSIKDANELATIVANLQQQSTNSTINDLQKKRIDRAMLVAASINSSSSNWQATKNSKWWKVLYDYGAYQNANYSITLNAGNKMNLQDYTFKDITDSGFIIVEVINGNNAGLWSINPYDVSVV